MPPPVTLYNVAKFATATVPVKVAPGQNDGLGPVGVTVNVTVVLPPVLLNEPLTKALPLAAIPVASDVISLVQLNVVPATPFVGENIKAVIFTPEQIP